MFSALSKSSERAFQVANTQGVRLAWSLTGIRLLAGLRLGQQQGPGGVAGEAADRGGRGSLSHRGKHQVYQQRLRPQADPQVRLQWGAPRRGGIHFFRRKNVKTSLEMLLLLQNLCGLLLPETT